MLAMSSGGRRFSESCLVDEAVPDCVRRLHVFIVHRVASPPQLLRRRPNAPGPFHRLSRGRFAIAEGLGTA